jgi:hypothetical protein
VAAAACLVRVAIPSLPARTFLLRRLDGAAEAAVEAARPEMATQLIDRLLTGGAGETIDIQALPLAVHDRLLAHIYAAEFGETVSCRAACTACSEPFEFRFPLPRLLAAQDREAAGIGPPDEDGFWHAPDGVRMRPPTLIDARSGTGAELIARISSPAPTGQVPEALTAFLERASPLLSLDIDTRCPECGAAQAVWFDLARFLVQALAGERPFLIRETHLLAARYGWSHDEIMALPRDDRRAFAALIESERSASLRRAS